MYYYRGIVSSLYGHRFVTHRAVSSERFSGTILRFRTRGRYNLYTFS
jgi:hypothetical protein